MAISVIVVLVVTNVLTFIVLKWFRPELVVVIEYENGHYKAYLENVPKTVAIGSTRLEALGNLFETHAIDHFNVTFDYK